LLSDTIFVLCLWKEQIQLKVIAVKILTQTFLPLNDDAAVINSIIFIDTDDCSWGGRKQTGENLSVICAEFSSLSWTVFVMSVIKWYAPACPRLELKTQPRFCPVSSNLSMLLHKIACGLVSSLFFQLKETEISLVEAGNTN
jgi:hypothetical protein